MTQILFILYENQQDFFDKENYKHVLINGNYQFQLNEIISFYSKNYIIKDIAKILTIQTLQINVYCVFQPPIGE